MREECLIPINGNQGGFASLEYDGNPRKAAVRDYVIKQALCFSQLQRAAAGVGDNRLRIRQAIPAAQVALSGGCDQNTTYP